MFLIRNANLGDAGAVYRLARHLDSYNLPADRKTIRRLLLDSEASFHGKNIPPHRRRYLFLAEETRRGSIAGCSLIIARHGTPALPHLSFEMGLEKKRSRSIRQTLEHRTMKLRADPRGFTEIGGLVLLPRYRGLKEKLGKQLSYVRFTYMALHPQRFQQRILVEYLPPLYKGSQSRLWEALGKKFTHLSYEEADRLSSTNKEFVLSLFPKEKIYACLLGEAATQELGTPGKGAQASVAMLQKIGFRFLRQVDPFDGGPHYGASLSHIPIFRHTAFLKVHRDRCSDRPPPSSSRFLFMTEKKGQVRAVATAFAKRANGILLPAESVRALRLRGGEKVAVSAFGL